MIKFRLFFIPLDIYNVYKIWNWRIMHKEKGLISSCVSWNWYNQKNCKRITFAWLIFNTCLYHKHFIYSFPWTFAMYIKGKKLYLVMKCVVQHINNYHHTICSNTCLDIFFDTFLFSCLITTCVTLQYLPSYA